jgi:hypothetical protein
MIRSGKRCGYSLIEVLVYMGVGGVIFFLGIQLVHMSLNISRASNDQWELDRILSSVARDFRRDMRRAAQAELILPSLLKIRDKNGNEIEWKVAENWIHRFGGAETKPNRQEYKFGRNLKANFAIEPSNEIMRLWIVRGSDVVEQSTRIERLIECRIKGSGDLKLSHHSGSQDLEEQLP